MDENLNLKINDLVHYAYHSYPPIRKLYQQENVDVGCFCFFELPVIDKHFLNQFSYEESFAVSSKDIVRVFTTSGTTGAPSYISLTQQDWDRQIRLLSTTFVDLGITQNDVFYDTVPRTTIFAAYLVLSAIERIGATVFPAGKTEIENHVKFIIDLKPTVLNGLAFFFIKLGEVLPQECRERIRILCLIGEFLYDSIRCKVESLYPNAKIYSGYGISEVLALNECTVQRGFHYNEDEYFIEVLNPDENGIGELTFTNMKAQAMPLIRYKSGDIGRIIDEPCSCGNPNKRFEVLGRIDNNVNIKGKLVNLDALKNHIFGIKGVVTAHCLYFPQEESRFEIHYNGNINEQEAIHKIKNLFGVSPVFFKDYECTSQWKKGFFKVV